MPPLIGVTNSFAGWPDQLDDQARLRRYTDALTEAGAAAELVFLAPPDGAHATAAELAARLNGLVIAGGHDLPPSLFGEELLAGDLVKLVPEARWQLELPLLDELVERGKPVLGICYGCQLLNVWGGGSLIQHLPAQWAEPLNHYGRHGVSVKPATRLYEVVEQGSFEVTSSHHQALARLAANAQCSAAAPDGVVEAIEFPEHPFLLGVQWHPECDPADVATQRLFRGLVAACRPTGGAAP